MPSIELLPNFRITAMLPDGVWEVDVRLSDRTTENVRSLHQVKNEQSKRSRCNAFVQAAREDDPESWPEDRVVEWEDLGTITELGVAPHITVIVYVMTAVK